MRLSRSFRALAFLLAITSPAAAVDFDAKGQASFTEGALLKVDFEGTLSGGFQPQPEQPLEGVQAATLAARQSAALPAIPLQGKQAISSSLFARGGAVNAYLSVRHTQASKQGDLLVPLFATGKVTSDGWYELRSAPVSLDASQVEGAFLYVQNLADNEVDVDAAEVVADGTFQEPVACKPPEDSVCGEGRVCLSGVCREGAAAVPGLPPADEREGVSALFSAQFDLFFGGLKTRKLYLPPALAEVNKMGQQAEPWAYWRQLLRGLHALHDAHTFGYIGYFPRGNVGACFVEGDGDLSHALAPQDATYPDVLVSHALPGVGLAQGDRLIAVNGQHPIAFMRSLAGTYSGGFLGCDDDSHSYAAGSLARAIPAYATTITVISCPGGACGEPKTIQVASLPGAGQDAINCDHRVGFHFEKDNPDANTHQLPSFVVQGRLADTSPDEALFGAAFDSFYPEGSFNPFQAIVDTARNEAKGVVLDHRAGGGGYGNYASLLSEPFRLETILSISLSTQAYRSDPLFDQAKGKSLFDTLVSIEGMPVGSKDPKPGLKAAVLIANGESSGDFFPFGMKGPSNIRIFGRRTQGAFSTAYYLAFGPMIWGFGSGETFRPDGSAMIGTGLLPDEDILPKQSDLVNGVDTVYARALEWLRTCTDCGGENP